MANIRAIVVKGRVGAITVGRPGPPGPGVQEYANLAAFPVAGTTGIVYLAQDTGLIYRWTGAAYTTIGGAAYEAASQAEVEAGTEAGLRSLSPLRIFQAIAAKIATMWGTTAGTICQGNDSRLSNARDPLAHKASHGTGGVDRILPLEIGALDAIGGTATNLSETKQATITGSVSGIDWSAGHVTIDYAGNTNISSGGFTNVPATGKRAFLSIFFKHNGGARTLTLPSTVKSTITLAGTSGNWDHIVLWTDDGGVNIYGQVVESK